MATTDRPDASSGSAAFTLLELMIVVAIIAILASMAVPIYQRTKMVAQEANASSEVKYIADSIDRYIITNGEPPDSLDEIEGLADMRDPWGNEYQYLRLQGAGKGKGKGVSGKARKDHNLVPINTDYDLYSMGPDGKTAPALTSAVSRDDIVRAQNGSFFGVAADY